MNLTCRLRISRNALAWVAAGAIALPSVARACATCFGSPDDAMTRSADLMILTMMGITVAVLGGFVVLFATWRQRINRLEQKRVGTDQPTQTMEEMAS